LIVINRKFVTNTTFFSELRNIYSKKTRVQKLKGLDEHDILEIVLKQKDLHQFLFFFHWYERKTGVEIIGCEKAIKHLYVDQNIKHQHFISFTYQAKSWHRPQQAYTKIESTGKGLNVRHFISNIKEQEAREIYFDFYVKRGEASENKIKEVKNMCFSDRLSNHGFLANFFRLFLSSLANEMFLLLKKSIKKTTFTEAKKWRISTIRTQLLKIGATIKITKKRIYYQLSKAFVNQELFREIITQ
jgi:hypothetical protein